jgi:hypothetical protein
LKLAEQHTFSRTKSSQSVSPAAIAYYLGYYNVHNVNEQKAQVERRV